MIDLAMAKSPTDRSREFRERRKAQARAALTKAPVPPNYLRRSFAKFVGDRHLDLYENLDAFGVFVDGSQLDEEVQQFRSQYRREKPLDALQRATALVDVFIEAAGELAVLINQHKVAELERAIEAAVEASANLPRGDVAAVKASLAEIDRLKAIRKELSSPRRYTFPAFATLEE